MQTDAEKIEGLLTEAQALLTGHFLLTSGLHSNKYMQCAKVMVNPKNTETIAKVIAQGFEVDQIDLVVAPAMGGILIGYEVARALGVGSMFTERVDGKMALRRGFEIPQGARVIIIEDVVTTGKSTNEVKVLLESLGANVVGVGSIIDRSGGVDFGVKFVSTYAPVIETYTKEDCPLCAEGNIELVKPGSRIIKD